MMNQNTQELAEQAGLYVAMFDPGNEENAKLEKFANLVVDRCVEFIECYRIPCGNSAAGEMAAEWTLDALTSIRQDIWQHFRGVDTDL